MSERTPRVWVVDDDADVRDALTLLLESSGHTVASCASGEELLQRLGTDDDGCILLDLRMPGMTGLEVQRELNRRRVTLPVVFLSGHGEIPIAVNAVLAGAIDFLEKPVREEKLLAAMGKALAASGARRAREEASKQTRALLASLSPREAEVADLILEGLRTTEIAERLSLSRRTVEMHRARLLRRLGARTSAEAAAIIQSARDLAGPDEPT